MLDSVDNDEEKWFGQGLVQQRPYKLHQFVIHTDSILSEVCPDIHNVRCCLVADMLPISFLLATVLQPLIYDLAATRFPRCCLSYATRLSYISVDKFHPNPSA